MKAKHVSNIARGKLAKAQVFMKARHGSIIARGKLAKAQVFNGRRPPQVNLPQEDLPQLLAVLSSVSIISTSAPQS